MDNGNGGLMLDHLDPSNNSDFVGGPFGECGHNETSMMMMLPSQTVAGRGVIVTGMDAGGYGQITDDVKLPTAKAKENYLKKYARKLGVNDRGCYIACALAILAFFFFIIIVAMASAWPGRDQRCGIFPLRQTPEKTLSPSFLPYPYVKVRQIRRSR
jgi:hypothetical protein